MIRINPPLFGMALLDKRRVLNVALAAGASEQPVVDVLRRTATGE